MAYLVRATIRRRSEIREILIAQYSGCSPVGAVKATYKMLSLMFKPNIVSVRVNKTIVGAMNDKKKIKHINRSK